MRTSALSAPAASPWRGAGAITAPQPVVGARSAARSRSGHVLDRPDRALWAVAETIGAADPTDIAARAAIGALDLLADRGPARPETVRALLRQTSAAIRLGRDTGSGASVVVARIDAAIATVLWAGDARAYRCRDDALDLLTRDHSVVQDLIDIDALPVERAGAHPHVVTRAIGAAPDFALDMVSTLVAPGDMLLLCAREVAHHLPAAMIARRLRGSASEAADAVLEAAICVGARGALPVVTIAL